MSRHTLSMDTLMLFKDRRISRFCIELLLQVDPVIFRRFTLKGNVLNRQLHTRTKTVRCEQSHYNAWMNFHKGYDPAYSGIDIPLEWWEWCVVVHWQTIGFKMRRQNVKYIHGNDCCYSTALFLCWQDSRCVQWFLHHLSLGLSQETLSRGVASWRFM